MMPVTDAETNKRPLPEDPPVDDSQWKVGYIYSAEYAELCDKVLTVHQNRSQVSHALVEAFDIFSHPDVEVIAPVPADEIDLREFHDEEYINFLNAQANMKENSPEEEDVSLQQKLENALGVRLDSSSEDEDDSQTNQRETKRSWESSSSCSSGSNEAARDKGQFGECHFNCHTASYVAYVGGSTMAACDYLAENAANTPDSSSRAKPSTVVFHWDGGRHHAAPDKATGYCYVNDVVLGWLKLLELGYKRVLLVDIDVHHGDGTQNAAFDSPLVCTLSVHQYGKAMYPGTGHHDEIGRGSGLYHTYNIGLEAGCSDETYLSMVLPIIKNLKQAYNPDVVMLVCGADSLAGDPLGEFNLSLNAYLAVVNAIKGWNLPLVVLGGGGYNVPNVARLWAAVTATFLKPVGEKATNPSERKKQKTTNEIEDEEECGFCGVDLHSEVPSHKYFGLYKPSFTMNVKSSNVVPDNNKEEQLQDMQAAIMQNIKKLGEVRNQHSPKAQTSA